MESSRLFQSQTDAPKTRSRAEDRARSRLLRHEARGLSPLYTLLALPQGCTRVFFPGCGLPAVRPTTALWTLQRLRALDPRTGVVLQCCGRPSRMAGFPQRGRAITEGLLHDLARSGVREIVTACPGCRDTLRAGAPREDMRVLAAEAALADADPHPPAPTGATVTIHDPCPTRRDGESRDLLRRIVSARGLAVEEMAHAGPKTACCGAGLLAPEKARAARRLRLEEARGLRIVTSCAGCVQALGRDALHVLDLLRDPIRAAAGDTRPLPASLGRLGRLWFKRAVRNLVENGGRS